jgi:chemotaxis protein MotA
MNPSTVIGMLGGVVLLGTTITLSAGSGAMYWNLPGLLIVLGGTLAATFVSFPLREVGRVVRVFGIVLRNERLYAIDDVEELVRIARLWAKYELSGVERELMRIHNPFLRSGVQLVIDGTPTDKVLELLEWRIARLKARERAEAQLFRTMATYAPAFGMLGTHGGDRPGNGRGAHHDVLRAHPREPGVQAHRGEARAAHGAAGAGHEHGARGDRDAERAAEPVVRA